MLQRSSAVHGDDLHIWSDTKFAKSSPKPVQFPGSQKLKPSLAPILRELARCYWTRCRSLDPLTAYALWWSAAHASWTSPTFRAGIQGRKSTSCHQLWGPGLLTLGRSLGNLDFSGMAPRQSKQVDKHCPRRKGLFIEKFLKVRWKKRKCQETIACPVFIQLLLKTMGIQNFITFCCNFWS